MTVDVLRQAWPKVVEAIKSKARVAARAFATNASVASFDEGVLTLRFPRQGDVKGFQGSKYEDLFKQAITMMFSINVVIRAVTGGGDAPSPGRRPGPAPAAAPPASRLTVRPLHRPPGSRRPPHRHLIPPVARLVVSRRIPPDLACPRHRWPRGGRRVTGEAEARTRSEARHDGGDLPPLPPPPPPDDEDFDPDDEDMSSSTTVNELTGMALVQRELGAQIIAEYDD